MICIYDIEYCVYIKSFVDVPSVTVGQGYTCIIGNTITMTCTIFSTPSATSVQWNRNTNTVPVAINVASNPTKYSGATVSTPSLTISNCLESDEGYYTCQATNAVGTDVSSLTFLNVQGSKCMNNLSFTIQMS